MKKWTLIWTVALLTMGFQVAWGQETPAETRARELARMIGTGDRAEARRYITQNFGGEMAKMPMEEHLGFFSWIHDITRGVEWQSATRENPHNTIATLKSKLTGDRIGLRVRVDPTAPHLITGVGLGPAKTPAGTAPARPLTEKEMAQELEGTIKKLVAADLFSGTVLLARDGVPIFSGAYGVANKDFNVPNRLDTKFNLGSMNKMFTGVAIMQLVERGQLSLDDPLAKFLPDFPDPEAAKKIRIKHLLTHTAGLGGYFSKRFRESSRDLYRAVDDMIKLAAADEKLLFEPGTRWQYSNTGMLVLGKVVEKVSGQSYYDFVRANIYQPAGMINTDCFELDKVTPNLAIGYDKEYTDSGVVFRNNIFSHVLRGGPQGGGYSTAEDLLKFDRALRGNKLLKPESVKLLLSAKPELNSPNYGFGFQVDSERQLVGHGGGFLGISSNLDMFLGNGYTAIFMSNYGNGAGRNLMEKMRELVRRQSSRTVE